MKQLGDRFFVKDIEIQQIHTIKLLWEALNAHHVEHSTHFAAAFRTLTFETRMAPILAGDPNDIKFTVIQDGEDICAYCISTIGGQTAEIHSLYVQHTHRNKRLGSNLVSLHQEWFKERNCLVIKLAVIYGNESILPFYRRLGFFELAIDLRMIQ